MSNDDKTPRQRGLRLSGTRGHMNDDERAEVGALHRLRDRTLTAPRGVPVHIGIDDKTPPPTSETWAEPESLAGVDLTAPNDLIMGDPVAEHIWAHVANVWDRIEKSHRATANRVLDLAASSGPKAVDDLKIEVGVLRDDVKMLKRDSRLLKILITAALTAAGGAVITVAKGIYERGEREGGDAVRLEHVERAIDRLRDDIDRIPRQHASILKLGHPELATDMLPLPASKGPVP